MGDLILLILAIIFAPPMVYNAWASRKRAQGEDVPDFRDLLWAGWESIWPWAELVLYGLRRLFAPAQSYALPALLCANDDNEDEAQSNALPAQTAAAPAQADSLPAHLPAAYAQLQKQRGRSVVVLVLVAAGWRAGEIRGVLKGDNGTIGAEVAAAEQQIAKGLVLSDAQPRTITISAGKADAREVEL